MTAAEEDWEKLPDGVGDGEIALASKLGGAGLARVDTCLLRHALPDWRKVVSIIVRALDEGGFDRSDHDAAFVLHARRVIGLVEAGRLEAQGDLQKPRWSEVRIPP